jgi:hypothetical protein
MGLSDSVAIGLPTFGSPDYQLTAAAVQDVRARRRNIEVRLGIGPAPRALPARLLGHAACITETITTDLKQLVGLPQVIRIFSSAPKTKTSDLRSAVNSLAMLAAALRLTGIRSRIEVDLANSEHEVPRELTPAWSAGEENWLQHAAERNRNGADPRDYAREHPANSMFGDLDDDKDAPFRVTIGAVPEAMFWAIRTRVRAAAVAAGLSVAPAMALVLKSCKVPWYSPTSKEPRIGSGLSAFEVVRLLDDAANPQHGGNPGLKREARALSRLAASASLVHLMETSLALEADIASIERLDVQVGPNVAAWLKLEQST